MAVLRVFSLVPLLSASLIWLYYLIQQAPITENQCTINALFPTKMDDIIKLNSCLKQYHQNNYLYILTLYSSIYIFKQTFCIPGSIILNVLAGSLFGTGYGFLLVCTLSSIGVSACYLMSKLCCLEEVITQFLPSQLTSAKISLENLVKKNQDQLWYLLTVLRVIPITPNWLLNLIAPVIKIPLWTFMYTTFFGLMPYNYICCQSGQTLSSINSLDEIFTFKTTLQLMSIAMAMVLIKVASKFCKIQT